MTEQNPIESELHVRLRYMRLPILMYAIFYVIVCIIGVVVNLKTLKVPVLNLVAMIAMTSLFVVSAVQFMKRPLLSSMLFACALGIDIAMTAVFKGEVGVLNPLMLLAAIGYMFTLRDAASLQKVYQEIPENQDN